jgi:hypothetical protein
MAKVITFNAWAGTSAKSKGRQQMNGPVGGWNPPRFDGERGSLGFIDGDRR